MERSFISGTGEGFPAAVFLAVLGIFILFIVHALLGVRKFPISWKQHAIIRQQMGMMKHEDTNPIDMGKCLLSIKPPDVDAVC